MKKYNHDWLITEWERMNEPQCEIYDEDGSKKWIDCDKIYLFQSDMQYRIKSKPWINWEHVSDEFNSMASNAIGCTHFFKTTPLRHDLFWDEEKGNPYSAVLALILSSFTPGTCAWQDSLVMRPVYQEQE